MKKRGWIRCFAVASLLLDPNRVLEIKPGTASCEAHNMETRQSIERCLHAIGSQPSALSGTSFAATDGAHRLAITISRQTGSGADCIAAWLAHYLDVRTPSNGASWTVFDRELVEIVLKEHNLPVRLARFMPEDRVTDITDTLDELFGVHPPVYTLVQQTAETILRLARQGNVILIGRGAHIVTRELDHVFHVRLVGSLEKRIEHIRQARGVGEKEALALIRREDRGRQRYLKKYFGSDIDDPLSYHLVVNTDSISYERAVALIGETALEHLRVRQSASQHPLPAPEPHDMPNARAI